MKNKRIFRSVTALLAALVIMGGFSVTAYAGGGEDWEDYEPIPEETPQPQPLTPEGNMTLVDDIEGEAAEDKQFITVVSKSGNYFYIIIDRSGDTENVYFLNLVDEADLFALLETDEEAIETEKETEAAPEPVCVCKDKCSIGEVNTKCEVCVLTMKDCGGKEVVVTPTVPEPEPEEKDNSALLLLLLLLAVGGGAAYWYFKMYKPKQNIKGTTELDDSYFEDDPVEYEMAEDNENDGEN